MSDENCISIDWQPDTVDETVIKFSKKYRELSGLEKADMLKDALYILTRRYNNVLKKGII
jgi:hypothetical protein